MTVSRRVKYRIVRQYGVIRESRVKSKYEFIAHHKTFSIQYLSGRSRWNLVDHIYEEIMNKGLKSVSESDDTPARDNTLDL